MSFDKRIFAKKPELPMLIAVSSFAHSIANTSLTSCHFCGFYFQLVASREYRCGGLLTPPNALGSVESSERCQYVQEHVRKC